MSRLDEFRNFVANRLPIDELVALSAFGKQLRTEYEVHNIEEPEFVDIQLKSLRREINTRVADQKEKMLRELKARRDALKTPAERKVELNKQIKDLEAELQEVGG